MIITTDSVIARAPAVAVVDHGDRIIALPLESPVCIPLEIEGGGVLLWRTLGESPLPVAAVLATISAEVDDRPANFEQSILLFLEQLLSAGLVTLRR